ncbi:acetylhydrolase [Dactylosporangium sp. AC04546]|uniref:alpha/beta hydrolase family protein n=1 Tax=Dactylosporangium sp. AC04546 TaxID=2862460 RepID=UPI001EDDEFE3|nr:acetylhydrolase [Dactylosporangium sp. AC04546]WVK78629.1 acetylhydrolase [Dactylosporangium sp. AC04546]
MTSVAVPAGADPRRLLTDGNLSLSRRGLITAALAAGITVPLGLGGRASAAPAAGPGGPPRLVLPLPTGPFPVGTVALRLVDRSRPDPYAGPGRFRELMVSVWYPARDAARYPRAQWMPEASMRALLAGNGLPGDAALAPITAGRLGAPVRRTGERLPVVVFSHGAHDQRASHTTVVQELASHGYVVLTVAHTYDTYVEFPDGRVLEPDREIPMGSRDFADDIPFVLDRVEDLAAGRNPDADGRPLPAGLRGAPDPRSIGVFGASKGATATVWAMLADPRIRAGLSLDGPMEPRVESDIDRPVMLVSAAYPRTEEPVAQAWSHLTGWRRNIEADGAVHTSFGDYKVLLTQLAPIVGMSDEALRDWVGTIPPARAVRIQQAYPLAFFDQHLRHRRQRLLEGPSRAFPEVRFIP